MSIRNSILSVILIILFISLVGNIVQYHYFRKEPKLATKIETDTITEIDTVFVLKSGEIIEFDPIPVLVDSIKNIKTFRDTFRLEYGWVATNEKIIGDMLSKNIEYKLNIPEYYKTRTVTNTITRTVRNDLFFVKGGVISGFSGGITPTFGAAYIWNNHRNFVSFDIGLNKQFLISAGVSFWK